MQLGSNTILPVTVSRHLTSNCTKFVFIKERHMIKLLKYIRGSYYSVIIMNEKQFCVITKVI